MISCGDRLELSKPIKSMKCTCIDTGAIPCLGIVNAVRPVSASALSEKGPRRVLTKRQTTDRDAKADSARWWRWKEGYGVHSDLFYRLCILRDMRSGAAGKTTAYDVENRKVREGDGDKGREHESAEQKSNAGGRHGWWVARSRAGCRAR